MMKFNVHLLHVLAYSGGFTHWHYRHNGILDELLSEDFFNEAGDMLALGDMIMVSMPHGGAMLYVSETLPVCKSMAPKMVHVLCMCRTVN